MTNKKKIDPIPKEFNSYEEAAEFWDKHDTSAYLESSRPVKVISEFMRLRLTKALRKSFAKPREKRG